MVPCVLLERRSVVNILGWVGNIAARPERLGFLHGGVECSITCHIIEVNS